MSHAGSAVAPPWFAVPPVGYGGIEAVVASLADGLVDVGHDVEPLACGGSQTRARLRPVYQQPPSALLRDVAVELHHVLEASLDPGGAELIHDHSGLVGPALGGTGQRRPGGAHAAWSVDGREPARVPPAGRPAAPGGDRP